MSETVATQEGVTQEVSQDTGDDLLSRLRDIVDADAQAEPTEDAGSDPQAEPVEETPAAKTLRVKVDGEEREVPVDEIVARYQKEASAEKRFEEAARLRKEAEESSTRINTERGQLQQAVNTFLERAQAFGPRPPDASLLDENPVEYLRQERQFQQFQAQVQQAQAAKAYLDQQQRQEREQHMQQRMQTEAEQLLKAIPHWSDEKKATAEKAMVLKHLEGLGYGKDELNSVNDHRLVVMARESALYRQLMSKAKEVPKQVAKAPVKVERPGVQASPNDGRTQAMQRLSRSGKVEDAAAIFGAMLGDN